MPKIMFDTALVKNLTPHAVHLRSGDGDSIDIMGNAEVKIDRKFLLWQPPSRAKIRILAEYVQEKEKTADNNAPIPDSPVEITAAVPVGQDVEALATQNLEADQAAETA